MRFSAIIGDSKSVDVFSRIVHIVSRLCRKRCAIKLTATEFSFMNAYNVREGRALDFRITQSEIFASYLFDGVSAEHNAVIFELPMDDLAHSITSKENMMKLKLSQRNSTPHLIVELKANCITHEIPIEFVLVRNWREYDQPNVGIPSVAISLPHVRVMHKVMTTLKNMGTRMITIKANNSGELSVSGVVDSARSEVYIHDLPNIEIAGENSEEISAMDEFFEVSVDLSQLYPLMANVHNYFHRVILKIVHGRAAILHAKQPDCQFTICLSGLDVDLM